MKGERWIAAALLASAALLFVWAISRLPISQPAQAFDWKIFWAATRDFTIDYSSNTQLYNPPWILALLWPLSAWPLAISRGLAALATTAVLAYSVPAHPRKAVWLSSLLALLLSYPALRHLADGNLEAIMVGGTLLLTWALRKRSPLGLGLALLLISAKVQEVWLLLPLLALYLWRNWPREDWLRALGWSIGIATPFLLWRGEAWWAATTNVALTWTNSSLIAVLGDLGLAASWIAIAWAALLVATLWVLWPRLDPGDRRQQGALLAAGLLLSPYASTLSVLTPAAVGLIPLAQRRRSAAILIGLFFLPYILFLSSSFRLQWENPYWTLVLVAIWGALIADIRRKPTDQPASEG